MSYVRAGLVIFVFQLLLAVVLEGHSGAALASAPMPASAPPVLLALQPPIHAAKTIADRCQRARDEIATALSKLVAQTASDDVGNPNLHPQRMLLVILDEVSKLDKDKNGLTLEELTPALARSNTVPPTEGVVVRFLCANFDTIRNLDNDEAGIQTVISPSDCHVLSDIMFKLSASYSAIGGACSQKALNAGASTTNENPKCTVLMPVPSAEFSPASSSGTYNVFDHSMPSRFWLSASTNSIYQYHPAFRSPYSGQNSYNAFHEGKLFNITSISMGCRLTPKIDAFFCPQRADGGAPSAGLGIAAYPNFDVQKNPSLAGKWYVARLGLHAVIPLSNKLIPVDRGPMNYSTNLPERRLEVRIGRFSLTDFFNYNSVGTDSSHQFMNFAVDADASYDYPADTRGYTWGGMVEYQSKNFAARFVEAAMPTVANGMNLEWNATTHGETYEVEHRHQVRGHAGVVRMYSYTNFAHMGSYRQAIQNYQLGMTPTPDITSSEVRGACKYGFGMNFEQEILPGFSIFSRLGWSEGLHETFCYTECDNTAVIGASLQGGKWGRKTDKIGIALVSDGLSGPHRQYLALGGLGMSIGDGALNYKRENILEMYYSCHLSHWKGLYVGPDIQVIGNPGYNHDRGPVFVMGFRVHTDF